MTDFTKMIADLEREILTKGVSINQFCRKASIDAMTWRRLRAGKFSPRQDTLARINKAIEQVRREPASASRVKRKTKPGQKRSVQKPSAHKLAEA
jgi:predicted transcriptional regulator